MARPSEPARRYMWITREVRMLAVDAVEELRATSRSLAAAYQIVGDEFEVHPNTVRNWHQAAVRAREAEADAAPGADGDHAMRRRLVELETMNAKLVEALRGISDLR